MKKFIIIGLLVFAAAYWVLYTAQFPAGTVYTQFLKTTLKRLKELASTLTRTTVWKLQNQKI